VPQFLKAAKLLHNVYFLYDLAYVFLYAYDLTMGSIYVEAYRERLLQFNAAPRQFANIRTHL
jgi:hypothetical protein